MRSTLAPDAYTALLNLITVTVQTPTTGVYDNDLVPDQNEPEQVVLLDITNGKQEWHELGQGRHVDEFDINGVVRVQSGQAKDLPHVRLRAYQILDLIAAALNQRPNWTLGLDLAGGYALLSSHSLEQGQNSQGGAAVELTFTVTVTSELEP